MTDATSGAGGTGVRSDSFVGTKNASVRLLGRRYFFATSWTCCLVSFSIRSRIRKNKRQSPWAAHSLSSTARRVGSIMSRLRWARNRSFARSICSSLTPSAITLSIVSSMIFRTSSMFWSGRTSAVIQV